MEHILALTLSTLDRLGVLYSRNEVDFINRYNNVGSEIRDVLMHPQNYTKDEDHIDYIKETNSFYTLYYSKERDFNNVLADMSIHCPYDIDIVNNYYSIMKRLLDSSLKDFMSLFPMTPISLYDFIELLSKRHNITEPAKVLVIEKCGELINTYNDNLNEYGRININRR